ncbi:MULTISPECIES: ABC transporter ATP-binding protein [unclassified Paenibacillus]|uniref:ABC transporter ATP-binding protein n=1 Tax=unclassified Paenibacillus TaxID=185978 RepID=UPI0008C28379|nr:MULTISPECIES: ABC transporter ATP-binding protein [unclassified Paenibacillus]QLG37822.1 ABC transporter ATP-binding protein [Paenibacillus sp. E222]SEO51430.1 putative ABC transport system ATP-binding protein [Paenibacillus sp. OK076]
MELLRTTHLGKIYSGQVVHRALDDISFSVEKGEFVGIMGPSGSGKTTLLQLIATIDNPTSGEVLIDGQDPHQLGHNALARFRRQQLGFIFQDYNLLNTLTILENIVLPLTLEGEKVRTMEEKAHRIADRLGIASILDKWPYEVSGGQAQRTAIARAIIHEPKLLLADEPTGNLDSKSSRDVMETLTAINRADGATMLLVTHDALAASYCHRVLFIKDGELYNEIHRGDSQQAFFQKIIDVLSLLGGNAHDLSTIRV